MKEFVQVYFWIYYKGQNESTENINFNNFNPLPTPRSGESPYNHGAPDRGSEHTFPHFDISVLSFRLSGQARKIV